MNTDILFYVLTSSVAIAIPLFIYYRRLNQAPPPKRGDGHLKYTPISEQDFSHEAMVREVREKWTKALELVAVHTDIPRLAKKISIYSERDGILLAATEGPDSESKNIDTPQTSSVGDGALNVLITERLGIVEQILQLVTSQVGEDSSIINEFRSYIKEDTYDLSVPLLEFLDKRLGENHKTTKVLKACNQSILAPCVLRLKFGLSQSKVRFKDKRGSWGITLRFNSDTIVVTQQKQEVSWITPQENAKEAFEFTWEQVVTLPLDVSKIKEVELKIIEFRFNDQMPVERRNEITDLFKEIYKPR